MRKYRSQEQWEREVEILGEGDYEFLENYVNTKTKIKCRHKKCGNEYLVIPAAFLRGSRCPKCTKKLMNLKMTKSQDTFEANVRAKNGDRYTLLSKYVNCKSYIAIRCNTCGYEDTARADVLEKGRQCKNCLRDRYSTEYLKTTEEYGKEIYDTTMGEYELVGDYTGVSSYVTIRHNKCLHEYQVYPFMFKRGRRCPNCNESKGESLVKKALDILGVAYKYQGNSSDLPNLNHRYSYDFYLYNADILIEYQGIQHYEPVELFGGEPMYKIQVANDAYKQQYALDNNYYLIEIPYTEDTLEKVINFLLADEKLKQHIS